MEGPPIPQRIPPLRWRRPSFVWTPLALAAAIGWPALLFYQDGAPQRLALVAGAAVFAIALVTLGVSWATGRAPRSRRVVVVHVVLAMAIVALAAPLVLSQVLSMVGGDAQSGLTLDMAIAMLPLVLVVGLPIGLVSGILFAWIALARRRADAHDVLNDNMFRRDAQPFR